MATLIVSFKIDDYDTIAPYYKHLFTQTWPKCRPANQTHMCRMFYLFMRLAGQLDEKIRQKFSRESKRKQLFSSPLNKLENGASFFRTSVQINKKL